MSDGRNSFLTFCPGPLATREPSKTEWQWAELLIWEYFRRDFRARFGEPSLVVGQLGYLNQLTGKSLIDEALKRMQEGFRNELAKAPLRKDIASDRSGGFLKPDVLGIAVGANGINVELVEVTTYMQADSTLTQDLGNKLRALQEKALNTDTSVIESDYYGRSGGRLTFDVRASKWRPRWDQMVFPLPPTGNKKIEWICYWPTFRFDPSGSGGSSGVDGLILYEIHSLGNPALVPREVLDRLREEVRRKKAAGSTLSPWISESYWKANSGDRDALLGLAAVAGIALLAVLCVTFWPVAGVGLALEGVELGSILASEAVEAEAVSSLVSANQSAFQIGAQVMQSLGRPIMYGPAVSGL